jgi:predicted RNase H-like HicB family nuclease
MMERTVTVKAAWDNEAGVWYVEESDLPGLHIEADTPIELYGKLPGAIEDLLEGSGEQEISFKFITPGRVKIAA